MNRLDIISPKSSEVEMIVLLRTHEVEEMTGHAHRPLLFSAWRNLSAFFVLRIGVRLDTKNGKVLVRLVTNLNAQKSLN